MSLQNSYIGFLNPWFFGTFLDLDMEESMLMQYNHYLSTQDEKQQRQLVEAVLSQYPREQAAEFVCRVTALSHEVKHFHDLLLSPWTSGLFRILFDIYFNIKILLVELVHDNCTRVGLPITVWAQTDATLLAHHELSIPSPRLRQVINRFNRHYKEMKILVDNGASHPLWWKFMLESAAFNVQAQESWNAFSESAASALCEYVTRDKTYICANEFLRNFFYRELGYQINNATMNAIYFLALCGEYADDYPHERAFGFLKFLKKRREVVAGENNIIELFNDYLSLSDRTNIKQSFDISQALTRDMLQRKKQALKTSDIDPMLSSILTKQLDILKQYLQARQRMIELYLSSPVAYHHPQQYRERSEEYPGPQVFFTSVRGLKWSKQLSRAYHAVVWAGVSQSGERAVHVMRRKTPFGSSLFNGKGWSELFIWALTANTLLEGQTEIKPFDESLREIWRREGITLIDMPR